MVAVIRSLTRSHTSQQKAVSYVQITRASSGQPLACKQWGSNTGGGPWHHFTFPIAFSTVFEIIGGYSTTSTGQIYGASNNITNTGFDMSIAKIDTGRYIAIGIWQWGKHLPANDGWTSSQVNFPIAFNSACLAVNLCIVLGDDKNDFESSVDHSPGLTSFSLYYSARRTRPIFWIAIGYWQWGYGNGYTYKTFPISFESFVKVVCTCDNDNWAGTRDITTTGFSLRAGGGACWLAVGM